jgi:hypothetical protein
MEVLMSIGDDDESMSDELFEELVESVREGGAILRGEKEASRVWDVVEPAIQQKTVTK